MPRLRAFRSYPSRNLVAGARGQGELAYAQVKIADPAAFCTLHIETGLFSADRFEAFVNCRHCIIPIERTRFI